MKLVFWLGSTSEGFETPLGNTSHLSWGGLEANSVLSDFNPVFTWGSGCIEDLVTGFVGHRLFHCLSTAGNTTATSTGKARDTWEGMWFTRSQVAVWALMYISLVGLKSGYALFCIHKVSVLLLFHHCTCFLLVFDFLCIFRICLQTSTFNEIKRKYWIIHLNE